MRKVNNIVCTYFPENHFCFRYCNWNSNEEESKRASKIESLMLHVALPYGYDDKNIIQEMKSRFSNVQYVDKLKRLVSIVFENHEAVDRARKSIQKKNEKWPNGSYFEIQKVEPKIRQNGTRVAKELMIANIFLFDKELEAVEAELRTRFPKMTEFLYERWCRRIFIKFQSFKDMRQAFMLGNWFQIQNVEVEVTLLNSKRIPR